MDYTKEDYEDYQRNLNIESRISNIEHRNGGVLWDDLSRQPF